RQDSGAAYVFVRSGAMWSQQAYIKASSPGADAEFGYALALSADGASLAVAAPFEASNAGAAYVFHRGSTWTQEARVQSSSPVRDGDCGHSVALSATGDTLAVGEQGEWSNTTGVGAAQTGTGAAASGAAYLFTRAPTWTQATFIKASNPGAFDYFGNVTL